MNKLKILELSHFGYIIEMWPNWFAGDVEILMAYKETLPFYFSEKQ
jgi:hypothetical protein